jgi:hypothetical protein
VRAQNFIMNNAKEANDTSGFGSSLIGGSAGVGNDST